MYKTGVFEDWVPRWLIVLLTFALNIPISMVMGSYAGIASILTSESGNLQEVYTYAFYASYVGMAVVVPLFFEMKRMLRARTILLRSYLSIVVLLGLLTLTQSPFLIVLISLLAGGIRMIGAFEIIGLLIPILAPKGQQFVKYSFLYPMIIALGQLGNYVLGTLAFIYDWKHGYYCIMALQLIPILIVLIFVHDKPYTRKIKFYMFDWFSFLLTAAILMIATYIATFGKIRDWLEAPEILLGIGVLPALIYILVNRLYRLKHPYIKIDLFWNKHFTYALGFMFLICMFYSSTSLQSAFYTTLLKYNTQTQAELGLAMIPGILVGAAVSFYWFKTGNNFKGIYLIAICAYLISHIQFYFLIDPYIAKNQLLLPIAFRGMGLGISYIAIATYGAQGFTILEGLSSVFWLILVRSVIGPVFFGSVYSNLLNYKVLDFTNRLSSKVDFAAPQVYELYQKTFTKATHRGLDHIQAHQLGMQQLFNSVKLEATMLSLQYIFGAVILAGFVLILLTVAVKVPAINSRKKVRWRKLLRGDFIRDNF